MILLHEVNTQVLRKRLRGICNNKITILHFTIACGVFFCALLFSGCKKKVPKSSTYGYITFTLNKDSLLLNDTTAETLRFCFYPSDKGPMIQTESDSGVLKMALPPGTYGLLVYNSNQNNIQFRKRSSLEEAEAYFAMDEINENKVRPLSALYGVVVTDLVILPNQDVTMNLTPTYFTKRVSFLIDMDKSLASSIKNCSGNLNGVTPALHINDRVVNRDTTTELPVFMEEVEDGFQGQVFLLNGSLNSEPVEEISHLLTFNFTLNDGRQVTSSLDFRSVLFDIKEQDIFVNIAVGQIDTFGFNPMLTCKSIKTNSGKVYTIK